MPSRPLTIHCDPAPVTVAVAVPTENSMSALPVVVRVLPFSMIRLGKVPERKNVFTAPLAAPLTPRTAVPPLVI